MVICEHGASGERSRRVCGQKRQVCIKISGKEAKRTDGVKVTSRWPHTAAKCNIGQQQISYQDLDFASLAGEMTIINSIDVSEEETYGRMDLLKMTTYNQTFAWKDVLYFHGSYLLKVEKGGRGWGGREKFLAAEVGMVYI